MFSSGWRGGSLSPTLSSPSSGSGDLLSLFATILGVVSLCCFFFELLPLPVPFPFGEPGVSPFWVGGSACFASGGVFVTVFGGSVGSILIIQGLPSLSNLSSSPVSSPKVFGSPRYARRVQSLSSSELSGSEISIPLG